MMKRVVISIDGGGIRGIIPLILLKQIQRRLSKDLFSMDLSWWGTSTGALISGAITIQSDTGQDFEAAVQNVLDLYEFRSAAAVHPHGVSIPARAFNQLIKSNFENLHLNQFPNLNIVTSKKDDLSSVIFNAKNACSLEDAISASCAFPGVFPAVEINGGFYVDGFFNAKNPTKLAYEHESKETSHTIYLSLGTGVLREVDEIENHVTTVHTQMINMHNEGRINYFRFNPTLSHAVDSMQNTSAKNILALRKDTMNYIAENEDEIQRFVKAILG
jgi:predicted acylesterase/phospholipase RssA